MVSSPLELWRCQKPTKEATEQMKMGEMAKRFFPSAFSPFTPLFSAASVVSQVVR
jgi:hypothetical protein